MLSKKQYAPIKVGSAYYKRPTSEQAFPVMSRASSCATFN
jgi:hypothetical protein